MKIKEYIIVVLLPYLSVLFAGCEKESNDALPPPRGVIEGYISSEGFPEVYFTSSVTPGINGTLADNLIRWGKVTISDGEETVIMTGRPESGNMPPFRYYTQRMRGEAGKSYTITADFSDFHLSATGRIPYPTPIDSVAFYPTAVDTLRSAVIYFTAPEDSPAYYYIAMQGVERGSRPYPCMMCTVEAQRAGEVCSLPIMRPRMKIDNAEYEPLFTLGEEFVVILNRVEKPVFDFWSAYENMVLFTNSPFLDASGSLPTNIEGGRGIFSPQGSSSMTVRCE